MQDQVSTSSGRGPGEPGPLRPSLKPVMVFLVLAAGLVVVYLSPLRYYLSHVRELKAKLAELGWAGPVAYMAGVLILVTMGAPRLLFCPIGGLAFGFVWGLVWTQIPTLIAYYVVFLFVRWGGRDFVLRHWPKFGHWKLVLGRRAILTLVFLRQAPVHGLVVNVLLALSPIHHADFLMGTALGLLPQAVPFTLVASGAVKVSGGESVLYILGGLLTVVLVWAAFGLTMRFSGWMGSLRRTNEGGGERRA